MDLDFNGKRQVIPDQLHALLDYLKQHEELAKGLIRGRRGKFTTLKLWNQCAKKLNTIEGGATKDGKGWSKYWCDWKYRVKKRALEIKAARDNNRPLPEGFINLSPLEEGILDIIGESALESVVIKTDPLADRDSDDLDVMDDAVSVQNDIEPKIKKRKCSRDFIQSNNFGESSKPRERKSARIQNQDDSDNDSTTNEFLRLERDKLATTKVIQESIQTIATEVTRLADIMGHIRDVLINNRLNL